MEACKQKRLMHTARLKYAAVAFIMAALAFAAGCIAARPELVPEYTIEPVVEETSEPMPSETPEATPFAAEEPTVDALGNAIDGADHYERYITFRNVQVYEDVGDTFLDCVIYNSYPRDIICAVSAVFRDKDGNVAATGSLRSGDGQYILVLKPGENRAYARMDTDTSLLGFDVELTFDASMGVRPS